MKRRSIRLALSLISAGLILLYFVAVFQSHQKQQELLLHKSPSSSFRKNNRNVEQQQSPDSIVTTSMVGKTKVVAFCNYNFRSLAVVWYDRMTRLGYTTHTIVATDDNMVKFLQEYNANIQARASENNIEYRNGRRRIRYDVMIHEPLPDKHANKPQTKKDHLVLELLMAVRWKYLLEQLRQGIHVLLTDVDNIFMYHYDPLSLADKDSIKVDVWHAYATKYPRRTYGVQGFVVCSGMSWWRSTQASIEYATLMHQACNTMCDDQRVLNVLIEQQLQIKWSVNASDSSLPTRISSETESDPRFIGLMTQSIEGTSNRIPGLTVKVWDRDFAFRGPLYPQPSCPKNVWVSMPILEAPSRGKAWATKVESFKQWDEYCTAAS